jgi:cbb3-type cytochrome oxidase maturation protein
MLSSIIILIILSAFLGLAAWLVFIWAVKKGQLDDIEGPKYRMLDDDVPRPDQSDEGKDDDA